MRGRARSAKEVVTALTRCFAERDLLTFASAIAFQVLYALVPLLLATIALLGFLGLEEAWTEELAPQAEKEMSEAAFTVIDQTVRDVLGERRGLWLTFGLLLATWQVSSAIRAAVGPLNTIYDVGEDRSLISRLLASLALAVVLMPLLMFGFGAIALGGSLIGSLDLGGVGVVAVSILRWIIAVPVLLAAIWLTIRLAPAHRPPLRYVSLGAIVIVGGWIVATTGFALYASEVASYETVFGGLAVVIVLLTYLYLLALVFIAGAQIDQLLRDRLSDETAEAA